MLRYLALAALLGVGWFLVLLLPPLTRGWLLANPARSLACLIVTSVIVSVVFRPFIRSAAGLRGHLVRAIVISYAGCALYLVLQSAVAWIHKLAFGGLVNVHDTVSMFVMGMTAAALGCFVVVPYGLLCQIVMHRTMPPERA